MRPIIGIVLLAIPFCLIVRYALAQNALYLRKWAEFHREAGVGR